MKVRSLLAVALFGVVLGCAPEAPKPTETSEAASSSSSSTYENPNTMSLAGKWHLTTMGADGEQKHDLWLKEDGTAEWVITSSKEGAEPITDDGGWKEDAGKILLHMHRGGAHIDLAFELKDDKLTAVEYPKDVYGEEGLAFSRPEVSTE